MKKFYINAKYRPPGGSSFIYRRFIVHADDSWDAEKKAKLKYPDHNFYYKPQVIDDEIE